MQERVAVGLGRSQLERTGSSTGNAISPAPCMTAGPRSEVRNVTRTGR